MSNRGRKNKKNFDRNNQQQSNNNKHSSSKPNRNQRRNNNNNNNNNNNTNQMYHGGSAMPVPSSRRNRARRTGLQSRQIQSSMEDSTWGQVRRDRIEDLKMGAPYNEWNSFFSSCSCDQIFQELTLTLKSQANMDINIHPSGYKIRGRKFINNIMCEFQIEMFYTTSKHKQYPNHILVEFQRRNGDGFVFQQFLHSIFKELQNTNLVSFSKFPITNNCYLSPTPLTPTNNDNDNDNDDDDNRNNDDQQEEKKQNNSSHNIHNNNHNNNINANNYHHDGDAHWQQPPKQIDSETLKMLIGALFAGDSQMCRSASSYLANNIANNINLVYDIVKLEPHIITKFSDLLLKCVDPQIVRSIGCTLFHMLQQSDKLKNEALKLNVKTVCKKVYKRWTEPVETRYGSNSKYVIRVIPSLQVAQRMSACIEVLE